MDSFANEIFVACVVWIDRYGSITEESFGASGRNNNVIIGNVPEGAFFVFMLNFDVGKGGLVFRAEIDEFFASVNQAIVPHFLKSGVNAINNVLVESKSEVVPGARGAKGAELEFHVAALLGYKVPNAGVEFVAVKFKASVALFFEIAFIDDPGFETSVVGARNIPSRFATEAVIASEGIFESNGEAMTDMKITVGVRWWHDNRIGRSREPFFFGHAQGHSPKLTVLRKRFSCFYESVVVTIGVSVNWDNMGGGIEGAGSLPSGINIGFKLIGFVATRKFHILIIP